LWGGEIVEEGPAWEVIQNPRRSVTAEIVGTAQVRPAAGGESGGGEEKEEPAVLSYGR
jgi:ABC-type methionine transport system ATPase subunit